MGMLVYVWTATLLAALWMYFRGVYTRFSRHGVKNLRTVPLLGNMWRPLIFKEHLADDFVRVYNAFPNERFVGRFEFVTPMVVVRDIELVKKITVKDFESFLDHRSIVNETSDPFFGRNLFALKGQEWKDMRSTLSPAFTSSKMRQMVPFMMEAGDNMIEALKMKIHSSEGYLDIDVKDLTTRYANDVIASCAFGLKVDSQTEDNQFYKMGIKTASSFSVLKIFILFALANYPNLARLFKLEIFPKTIRNFFRSLVSSTMGDREASGIIRPDLINLLMEAKKGKIVHEEKSLQDTDAGFATVEESVVGKRKVERVWAEDDLISQAVLFFIAGFEGISAVMSFTLHELAVNPEVQDKLLQEIIENNKKNNGKFDYKSIQNMTYLDMVVSEVLRKWPAGIALDRTCNKDYNLGKPNSQATEDFYIRKGEVIMIPVWAFHHDPAFFPNPSKFDPERFSEENKHKINPLSYVPFGLGPRNCIGSRFALCEIKVMLYKLLQHMEVCPNEKTRIPARLSAETFNLRMHGGHWLRVKLRNKRQTE